MNEERNDTKTGTKEQFAKPVTKPRGGPRQTAWKWNQKRIIHSAPLPAWADIGWGFGQQFFVECFSPSWRNVQLHHHHLLCRPVMVGRRARFELGQSVWDLWWAEWQGSSPSQQHPTNAPNSFINTLRTGLLNCLNARSRGLTFRHRASSI